MGDWEIFSGEASAHTPPVQLIDQKSTPQATGGSLLDF